MVARALLAIRSGHSDRPDFAIITMNSIKRFLRRFGYDIVTYRPEVFSSCFIQPPLGVSWHHIENSGFRSTDIQPY
jgi:hypothetical protein